MTQQVISTRFATSEYGTFAAWSMDGKPLCVSVELPWKDNQHFISCIPAGTYRCTKMVHIKHGTIWRVNGVPGRDDILLHQGNTIKDLLGCIAPGLGFGTLGGLPAVISSDPTFTMLRGVLDAEFDLVIREAYIENPSDQS